jgi:hypothetical protein
VPVYDADLDAEWAKLTNILNVTVIQLHSCCLYLKWDTILFVLQ